MVRTAILVAIGLMCGACDPGYIISTSRTVPNTLDKTCVLETLRTQETVSAAGVSSEGKIYADVVVPEQLGYPKPVWSINVDLERKSASEFEIRLRALSLGRKPSSELSAYMQKVLDELRDRVVEKCNGR